MYAGVKLRICLYMWPTVLSGFCCKGPLMALCAGGAAWAVAGLQSSRCSQEPQICDRCAVKHCSEQHVVSQGKQMVRGPFSHNRPHNNWWWILSSTLVTMLVAF